MHSWAKAFTVVQDLVLLLLLCWNTGPSSPGCRSGTIQEQRERVVSSCCLKPRAHEMELLMPQGFHLRTRKQRKIGISMIKFLRTEVFFVFFIYLKEVSISENYQGLLSWNYSMNMNFSHSWKQVHLRSRFAHLSPGMETMPLAQLSWTDKTLNVSEVQDKCQMIYFTGLLKVPE